MKLCIPADFDYTTLSGICEIDKYNEVYEMYGNLNPSPFLSSGRGKKSDLLPKVDWEQLEKYIRELEKRDKSFNYTLNPACISNYELTIEGRKKIIEFVKKLDYIGVKSITVAIPAMIEIIKNNVSNIEVCASAIASIDTVNKAKFYAELGADRLVLKEDICRDFELMKSIIETVQIPTEVVVNCHCQFDCPLRIFHYNSIAHYLDDNREYYKNFYTDICGNKSNNEILKIRWIRPEDIKYYEKIGVTYFKIIGRTSAKESDLIKTCQCYIDRNFNGNYVELLNNFPKNLKSDFYLDNKKLDGFINHFLNNKLNCNDNCGVTCNYCINYFKGNFYTKQKGENEVNKAFIKNGITKLIDKDEISRAIFEVNNI